MMHFCPWRFFSSLKQTVQTLDAYPDEMMPKQSLHCLSKYLFRPNKKISVFRVTGLKILGRVGTHIFFNYFFFWKKNNFMHFERHEV